MQRVSGHGRVRRVAGEGGIVNEARELNLNLEHSSRACIERTAGRYNVNAYVYCDV